MPTTATLARGALSAATLAALNEYFSQQGHRPSADHWDAIGDVAAAMEAMANGAAPAKVMLSALDCGVGKTQTTTAFARALVASPDHGDVGMMICVGRLAEAADIADSLGIPAERLAVLTSDQTLNAKGGAAPDAAQVLVTTQQRLERAADGRTFAEVSAFHYRGRPRQVRVWDEAWLPGATVTVSRDDLMFLPKLVRPLSDDLAEALLTFAVGLRDRQDGDAVEVPDFEAVAGVSLYDVLGLAAGAAGRFRDDQQQVATALVTLNGRVARVRRDGMTGNTVLSYRDTLPPDLAPLLVLDASGRVRRTYSDMEQHRGNLVRLRAATKDYSPLTIRTWQTSGSKSGFARQGDTLAKGIADTIRTKPQEGWLVVVHRQDGRVQDVEGAIKRHLGAQPIERLDVITWGQHMATNAYADTANVILAGTLFMRPSFYTSLTHLSRGQPVAMGLAHPADVAETMRGEHRHLIYQAICRGRVRKSDGDKCQPMTAYIIASPRSGIPADLPSIFPGCTVQPWNPTQKPLKGQMKRAVDAVRRELATGTEWLPYAAISALIKMDPRNFRKRITKSPAWAVALGQLGARAARKGSRGAMGLVKVA